MDADSEMCIVNLCIDASILSVYTHVISRFLNGTDGTALHVNVELKLRNQDQIFQDAESEPFGLGDMPIPQFGGESRCS